MTDKYIALISGEFEEVAAIDTSAGAGSAGEIPALDSTGRLNANMMPVGIVPEVVSVVTSENLAAGDLVNIYDATGTPTARKADCSNGRRAVGFVLAGSTSPAAANVYLEGLVTGLTGLTAGDQMYLDVTGQASATPPSTGGYISQQIGTALSDTVIAFQPLATITLA